MTISLIYQQTKVIIPYQELLGNYDRLLDSDCISSIIPYQELLGNYDIFP